MLSAQADPSLRALHLHLGGIAGSSGPAHRGERAAPPPAAVDGPVQPPGGAQPAVPGATEADRLRVRGRGERMPGAPGVAGGQHHTAHVWHRGAVAAVVPAARHGESRGRRDEVHRADQRARLGQRRPVRAAIGRRQQAGVARGPAVLPVHEVNAGQVERTGQLNPPVRAAVGGRQDHVLADRPALAGRHELHSGEVPGLEGLRRLAVAARAGATGRARARRRRARCGRARGRGGAGRRRRGRGGGAAEAAAAGPPGGLPPAPHPAAVTETRAEPTTRTVKRVRMPCRRPRAAHGCGRPVRTGGPVRTRGAVRTRRAALSGTRALPRRRTAPPSEASRRTSCHRRRTQVRSS